MTTYYEIDKIEIETANDVPETVWLFSGSEESFPFTVEDLYEIQANLRDGQTDFYVTTGDEELIDSCYDSLSGCSSWEILHAGFGVQLLDSKVVRITFEFIAEGFCENEWGEQIGESETDGFEEGYDIPYDLFMSLQL